MGGGREGEEPKDKERGRYDMSRESEDGQGGENYRNQQKICQQPQGERGGDFGLWSVRVGEIFPHFQNYLLHFLP